MSSVSPERCGDNRPVSGVARHLYRIKRFGDGADLIELDEQRVADVVSDAALQNLGIRHEHVVSHELDAGAELARQHLPPFPIALRQAVLDGNDRVIA